MNALQCRVALASFAVTSVTALPCHARLGETEAQSIARYGNPIPAKDTTVPGALGNKSLVFQKNGFSVTLIFFNGVVGAESIFKIEGSEFSDNEKQALLDADSSNLHWTALDSSDATAEVWARDDKAVALYNTINHSFTFESKEYYDAAQAKKEADEKSKLKDF